MRIFLLLSALFLAAFSPVSSNTSSPAKSSVIAVESAVSSAPVNTDWLFTAEENEQQRLPFDSGSWAIGGLVFNSSGTHFAIIDNHTGDVYAYSTTNFEPIGASRDSAKDVDLSADTTDPTDIAYNDDCTIMYVLDKGGDTPASATPEILVYDLSSACDPSTATKNASWGYDLNTDFDQPTHMEIVKNGTEIHLTEWGVNTIEVYELSTAWRPSTMSRNASKQGDLSGSGLSQHRTIQYRDSGAQVVITGEKTGGAKFAVYDLSSAYDPSTMSIDATYDVTTSDTFVTDMYIDETNEQIVYIDLNGSKIQTVEAALTEGSLTAMQIQMAHSNWISLNEVLVNDTNLGERFSEYDMTNVNGAPGNDFTTISDDQFTTDSNYNGSAIIQEGTTAGPHWSDSGTSGMNVYIEWSWGIDLNYVDLWFGSIPTYGLPPVVFKDGSGTTLTPTDSPSDLNDYEELSGGIRRYRWTF